MSCIFLLWNFKTARKNNDLILLKVCSSLVY